MLNGRALLVAASAGTVAQVAMVVAGHMFPPVKAMFAIGGMGISLLAGLAYGLVAPRDSAAGAGALALGGLVAGAVCAFLGILVSYLLSDVPATLLVLGTVSSAVTGAIGGLVARLIRRPRAGIAALVLLAALPALARAQAPAESAGASAAVAAPAGTPVPAGTTADFAWLAGRWEGRTAISPTAVAEVVFTPPAAGLVTGVMRLTDRGKILVVELITLVDAPAGPELRFRHFAPDLTAYEQDFRQSMRLTRLEPTRAVFENQVAYDKALMSTQPRTSTFTRTAADAYTAHSDIIGSDGQPATIEVTYRRVP